MVGPPAVQVVQHDPPADPFHLLLGSLVVRAVRSNSGQQFVVALRRELTQFLSGRRRAQQRVPPLHDDGPLLGDQLVVAPRVGMDVQQPAFGDTLRVVEQDNRLRAGDPAGLVAFHRQFRRIHMGFDDVILPTGKEHRRSRITLTPGAAAQLVVQPLSAVPAGADYVQPAEIGHRFLLGGVVRRARAAQPDIGTATGHLGRHRHRPELARLGDDGRLFLVVLGVEDDGGNTAPHQSAVEVFGFGDVMGSDQHGLTGGVHLDDVVDDRLIFGRGADVDPIGFVDPHVRGVQRNRRNPERVELSQLLPGGQGGSGHPAYRRIPVDQRLHRDGVEHLAGLGGLDALLGLDGRLQPVRPALQGGDPAAGGVDQLHGTVADDVVHVALQQDVGVQGDVDLGQCGGDVLL